MNRLTILGLCILVFSAFFFLTCNDGGDGGTSREIIGPEGGEITSADGRLTITFPPGALSEDTEITIRKINTEDLPPEFDGLDVDIAYSLEPDGIEFNFPVTASFLTDEAPVQDDGSLSSEGALLLTSSSGVAEVIENLTLISDADENTTIISGELSHFSDLWVSELGIDVRIFGIPASLPVGGTFNALVQVLSTITFLVQPPQYTDFAKSPLVRMFEPNTMMIPFTDTGFGKIAEGSFLYGCNAPGTGKYITNVTVDWSTNPEVEGKKLQYVLIPIKSITCGSQPGPSPQPSPQPSEPPNPEPTPSPSPEPCVKVGTYESTPPPTDECGIGMFSIINISGEGNLIITGFGANPDNTTFNKTNELTVFDSANTDLIIFGQKGHSCHLKCNPSNHNLTLECERTGAMCTEVFFPPQ